MGRKYMMAGFIFSKLFVEVEIGRCRDDNNEYLNTLVWEKFILAPVLKTIFHHCVISYNCSLFYSDGSVLKQSMTSYKYMI